RLLRLADPQARLRQQLHAERREQLAELAQLAEVVGCQHHLRELHPQLQAQSASPSAARCALTSREMPARASSSSVSTSPRLNGTPSAVPWISTKPPAPVITTFMSVSQPESSS